MWSIVYESFCVGDGFTMATTSYLWHKGHPIDAGGMGSGHSLFIANLILRGVFLFVMLMKISRSKIT